MMHIDRRQFIRSTAKASLAVMPISSAIRPAFDERPRKILLEKNAVVLFQGDSITDAARERKPFSYDLSNANRVMGYNDFNVFGAGYVLMAATRLLFDHPESHLKIFNRGISGDKINQLTDRWQADCLDLQPSVISILVGVNDYWHTLTNGYKGTTETYNKAFRTLLDRTKEHLPNVRFIIGEPFAMKGVQAVTDAWYPAFDEYQLIAKNIAQDYNAAFIPYQKIFNAALDTAPASYWTFDGVHPSVPGCQLMANAWLKTVTVKK